LIIGNSSKEFPFQKKDILPKIKRTCAFDAKIVGFSGVRFWLRRYNKRGKKIFDLAVFGVQGTYDFD
jgi:hypothetical protein